MLDKEFLKEKRLKEIKGLSKQQLIIQYMALYEISLQKTELIEGYEAGRRYDKIEAPVN